MQETEIIGDKISSKFFKWNKESSTFTAEASSLPKTFDPQTQIWSDSFDVGFIMEGEKTGANLIFTFSGPDYYRGSDEEELMGWIFTAHPQLNKKIIFTSVRVLIIND